MKRYTKEWNKRIRFQVQNPVGGVFKPFDHCDSDDSDDEDDDVQFLSFKEIKSTSSGGKRFFQRSKPRQNKGTLVDQRRGRQVIVKGGFHLTDPWWRIQISRTIQIGNGMNCPRDMHALSYQLVEKEWMLKNGVLYQFLDKFVYPANKTKDNRPYRKSDFPPKPEVVDFDKFVRETLREGHKMTFDNLNELLERYEDYLPEERKGEIKSLRTALNHKEAQLVYKAPEFPLLFGLLPQLLPMQFMEIISMDGQDLRALETDLQERPWVFGFKQILSKDHHIIGCEAKWNEFEKSGLDKHVQQPYKDGLLIYDFLKFQSTNGHTRVTSNDIQQEMRTYVSNYMEALRFLKRNKVVKEETIKGRVWVYLYHLYKAEEYIATGVTHLFQEQMKNQWILNVDLDSEKFNNIRNDPDQLKAARLLTQFPVVVISGKGGCGKTTVVTKVMSSCRRRIGSSQQQEGEDGGEKEKDCHPCSDEKSDEEELEILYTAPTGKAANLLGKRAGTVGYTLHQVTYSFMMYCRKKKEEPALEWTFKNVNVLVVDECSLVAVTTFHSLFRMLVNEARLRRIVLLGDKRQLPSIEPGNFLSDMFDGLQNLGCAIELRTNHRSESQLIVDNATRISQKRCPIFDPARNFKHYHVDCDKDNDLINEVILQILRKEKSLMNDKTSQFVTFKNKDATILNEVCLRFYNNHPQKDTKNKLIFRVDDKICMTKNGRVPVYEYSKEECEMKPKVKPKAAEEKNDSNDLEISGVEHENEVQADDTMRETQEKKEKINSPDEIRLCNGEVFFIKDDKTIIDSKSAKCTMTRYLYLSNEDPEDAREFWCDYKDLKKICKIRHAWARTIHTFQGSETNAVVYYLGPSVSWQNWQHVYTAVTRGKKEVYIMGSDIVLNQAITKTPNDRWTSLQDQLNKILPNREKLNQSLLESPADTEDLPYTETNSFCMDNPDDEPFTRIKLSPYKPDHQSSKPGPSGHQPTPSMGAASSSHHSGLLNSSLKPALPSARFPSPRHLNRQATSSPFVRQTVSNFNNVGPVQMMDSPAVSEMSYNSQWSEADESLLFLSEEQARNESLLENCGPLEGGKSDQRKENGDNPSIKNAGCESDATLSPDDEEEDVEMEEEEAVRTVVERNGSSRRVRQDRLPEFSPQTNGAHRKKSGNLSLNKDKLADCVDNFHEDEGELTRLCNVAERRFDLKRLSDNADDSDEDSEIERYSPSLLSAASVRSKKRISKDRGTADHERLNSHRSVIVDDEFSDDSDDDRSSPSLLSSRSSSTSKRTEVQPLVGEVTPKKQKMEKEQSYASPMRRKLDNLSMSQD